MSVGESLTEARCQAGLSVEELSERTRIRGTVIRSIERGDYAACGGDLYVRGYLRAIAGAVGVDPQPLLREFDLGRASGSPDPDATVYDLPFAAAGPLDDPAPTRFDLPPVTDDPAATRFDLPPVLDDLMAAGYEIPAAGQPAPARPATEGAAENAPAPGTRAPGTPATGTRVPASPGAGIRAGNGGRSRGLWAAIAAVLALAAVVFGFRLASGGAGNAATSTAVSRAARASNAPRGVNTAKKPTAAKAKPGGKHPGRPSSRPAASRAPAVTLPILAARAYGPGGLADGDNPQVARYAIEPDAPGPWTTQWYDSAQFGLLKHGTGLLLDLGHRVTITSVRIDLARYYGANLRLRAGDGLAPGGLRVVAARNATGGVVRLTLRHPATARYLLVWFTLLPPNGSGHYQESVYRVVVRGRR